MIKKQSDNVNFTDVLNQYTYLLHITLVVINSLITLSIEDVYTNTFSATSRSFNEERSLGGIICGNTEQNFYLRISTSTLAVNSLQELTEPRNERLKIGDWPHQPPLSFRCCIFAFLIHTNLFRYANRLLRFQKHSAVSHNAIDHSCI